MDSISFEDSIFIVNIRIKALKDTLRLSPPPELFLDKCLDDLAFINRILGVLAQFLQQNGNRNENGEFEDFLDAEWQFNQLILEFSNEARPFTSKMASDKKGNIASLREASDKRRKVIDEMNIPADIAHSDQGVSPAELNSLFGGN